MIIEISNNFLNLSENSVNDIENSANLIIESIKNGNKIMFCGNGGSAADSQHLAAELIGRYRKNRSPCLELLFQLIHLQLQLQ